MSFNGEVGIAHVIGFFGLFGLWLSYRQFTLSQRANRAKLIVDLSNWFTTDKSERSFFYRLDYTNMPKSFAFTPESFRGSEDEQHLDALLYKLSYIGALVRSGAINADDLGWLRSIVDIVLRNHQVHAYLDWLRTPSEIPNHSSFADAVYLFEQLHRGGANDSSLLALRRYTASPLQPGHARAGSNWFLRWFAFSKSSGCRKVR